jgi:ribosomal protein S27AE
MHGKEHVLRQVLETALGVKVMVAEGIDTDEFGTFSGEVERTGSPLEAARQKCRAAQKLTGASLVLASEGSFGAHPFLGFVPGNEELLLLRDYQRALEFKVKLLSTETNWQGRLLTRWEEVMVFANSVGFPSHALMLRAEKEDRSEIHKGVNCIEKLERSFNYFRRKSGTVWVETDMRAHHNPTRMMVIAEAAAKLLALLDRECPLCGTPGFDLAEVREGLPCGECQTPTRSAISHLRQCQHCRHTEEVPFPHQKKVEDPMFCDSCNP